MTYFVHPVILCGGMGTRLWPLSTPSVPKPFLSFFSERSLLEETADRVAASHSKELRFARPTVVGSAHHVDLINSKLPRARKIFEPMGRGSAAAIATSCLAHDADDVMLILAADHHICNVQAFHQAVASAVTAACAGRIITFGVKPSHPATGYGYIKVSGKIIANQPVAVDRFIEKPTQTMAISLLDSGSFLWNAGIFMFRSEVMIEALETHTPDILKWARASMKDREPENLILNKREFARIPEISIDYAVMQHSENLNVVPVDMDWADVGDYSALRDLMTESDEDNYVHGPVLISDSSGVCIRSEGPVVCVNGVSDVAIVATSRDILISRLNDSSAIKRLGSEVRLNRYALGVPTRLIRQARDWLSAALDTWAQCAWDESSEKFVERLNSIGEPSRIIFHRTEVQAQQLFSFATALELGWIEPGYAESLIEKGVDCLGTELRDLTEIRPQRVQSTGARSDRQRALSEYAFVILACTAAFRATGNRTALSAANAAIAIIDHNLKDDVNDGWHEGGAAKTLRHADSHKLLLEAMLTYYEVLRCNKALSRAAEIVRLFESRLFNPANDILAESFCIDWRLNSAEDETVFRPIHHYEWATLLRKYEQITGHDTRSWQRRLIKRANSSMSAPKGFIVNKMRANGDIVNENKQLATQLEMLRAHFYQMAHQQVELILGKKLEVFFKQGPKGLPADEIGPDDTQTSTYADTSTLYHLIKAFAPLTGSQHFAMRPT